MAKRKAKKEKSAMEAKSPKVELVLGYFRHGTAVAVIAEYINDGRIHQISDVLEHAQKVAKITAKQADFAFRVLFINRYKDNGGTIGKLAARKLGGAIVNLQAGSVQYFPSRRTTEVIKAKPEEKPAPKAKHKPRGES